ncbi:MAG TPA: RNA polymerase sigma factor [Euzebya sp.]|nr:RNA polymerase sigma factor [Euzebya sp.]
MRDGPSAEGAVDDGVADEELLRRVVAGEHAAYATLVRRHHDLVFAICWRFFRNDVDAEDATQETFVALFRGAATFTGSARVTTWLYRIATNTCHDLMRRRVRRPQSAGIDPTWLPGQAPDDIAALELELDLRQALERLAPEHREVVVLHSLMGWSHADIAGRTGVALGTVKSRIHRAHAHLATILLDSGWEPERPAVLQSPDTLPPSLP